MELGQQLEGMFAGREKRGVRRPRANSITIGRLKRLHFLQYQDDRNTMELAALRIPPESFMG